MVFFHVIGNRCGFECQTFSFPLGRYRRVLFGNLIEEWKMFILCSCNTYRILKKKKKQSNDSLVVLWVLADNRNSCIFRDVIKRKRSLLPRSEFVWWKADLADFPHIFHRASLQCWAANENACLGGLKLFSQCQFSDSKIFSVRTLNQQKNIESFLYLLLEHTKKMPHGNWLQLIGDKVDNAFPWPIELLWNQPVGLACLRNLQVLGESHFCQPCIRLYELFASGPRRNKTL